MLGTWRTNDAEKNHTHKIRKKKKEKRKKGKETPRWTGWTWKMAWAFCVGRNRGIEEGETHEGRKELRYDTRGSASESEWHE